MKNSKKILALVLSLVMIFAMSIGAYAKTITITAPDSIVYTSDQAQAFKAYQIFTYTNPGGDATSFQYVLNPAFAGFETDTTVSAVLGGPYNSVLGGKTLVAFLRSPDTSQADMETLSEALHAYAIAKPIAATGTGSLVDGEVTFNLDDGYYLISNGTTGANDSGVITRYILDTTNTDTINIKADAPTIDKKIESITGNGKIDPDSSGKDGDARIGDVINYVLTSKVPDMTGYSAYTYKIHDTMSEGLTFNNDVVVTIGGSDYSSTMSLTQTIVDGGLEIEIDFGANFINQTPGADIVVKYSATLNNKAVIDGTGNTNQVDLEYSNDPYDETDTETTPPDEVVTAKTFDFDLFKYDIEGNGIQNVIFNLHKVVESVEGAAIKFASDAEGYYPSATGNVALTTDANGRLYVRGLEAGTYHLKEMNAEALGYDAVVGDMVITIDDSGNVAVNTDHANVDYGELETGVTPTEASGDISNSVTILNTVGGEFPSTGGVGTTMFTLGGLSMMAGAALILIIKKSRMAKAN